MTAGPSKKRKVAAKGKGKEKEKLELESGLGADAGTALLAEMRGMREEIRGVREEIGGLRAEFRTLVNIRKVLVRLLKDSNKDVRYITDQMGAGSASENGDGEAEGGDGVEKTVGVEGLENEMEETLQ
jgi:hypothetical protein